ncbi:unnamed protein product, partial [Ixodes pacificus]
MHTYGRTLKTARPRSDKVSTAEPSTSLRGAAGEDVDQRASVLTKTGPFVAEGLGGQIRAGNVMFSGRLYVPVSSGAPPMCIEGAQKPPATTPLGHEGLQGRASAPLPSP